MSAQITITIPVWLDMFFVWPVMLYRRWKYGYEYRRIYLGEGEWAVLDQEDYYRFGNLRWGINGSGDRYYAVRNVKTGTGRTTRAYMHREIMNPPAGLFVDHINNDPLDNRRKNLRLATQSQNCQNVPKKKNTLSRFIGVSFHKQHRKWYAYINYEGKRESLCYFANEIDAAKAYDEAAKKYYGEFARLNFSEVATPS